MSAVGWVHTVFALVALLAGAVVLLLPKGTRAHRTVGHVYATSMAGLLVTAFAIYELLGGFGPFHVAALAAAATLVPAIGFVLLRRPRGRWMALHARWMAGSYIGLACAFTAETTSRWLLPPLVARLPEAWSWPAFWGVVLAASAATGWLGARIAGRHLPRSLERAAGAVGQERGPDVAGGRPGAVRSGEGAAAAAAIRTPGAEGGAGPVGGRGARSGPPASRRACG